MKNNIRAAKAVSIIMSVIMALGMCSCGKKSGKVSVRAGDTVMFGTYEGRKIEWIVLDTGKNGALLITKEGLDVKQMDDETEFIEYIWEDCDLHAWLNGGFYETSFSDDEKKQINKTTVRFEKSPSKASMAREGQDTEDYVFLLSYSEAKKYFRSDEARMCPVSSKAKANGGFEGYNGNCKWWLRTNSAYKNSFLVVNEKGHIEENKGMTCYAEDICIRPVMWVSI